MKIWRPGPTRRTGHRSLIRFGIAKLVHFSLLPNFLTKKILNFFYTNPYLVEIQSLNVLQLYDFEKQHDS